ncbi:hypothetical protein D3C80_542450 [compost metagenome]
MIIDSILLSPSLTTPNKTALKNMALKIRAISCKLVNLIIPAYVLNVNDTAIEISRLI